MTASIPTAGPPAAARGVSGWGRWMSRCLLAGLVGGILWFYAWTANPAGWTSWTAPRSDDYYNLLTRGFLKGSLALDAPADPALAKVKDPWNPVERGPHGLPDASYYRGRYYLYFGVTPAVVLFLPFRLATGRFITESAASLVFAAAGLLASIWLLLAIRRRYFPGVSARVAAGGVLALGLTNMMPVLLRRPGMWEVPITCGYALFMIALAALFAALHARRRAVWVAVASAALALAVGARPIYLVALVVLLPPLAGWAGEAGGLRRSWRDAAWRRTALAAVLPAVAVGAGLALYNLLRFGNPLEFGHSYQLSSDNLGRTATFGWRYFLYGMRLYLFAPAHWGPYFPFVNVISAPPAPPGQFGIEDPYGIFPNIPFVLLALGLATPSGWRRLAAGHRLALFVLGVMLASAGLAATVMAYAGAANRYMVDFLPGLVLLAGVGWFVLAGRARRRLWRWLGGAAAAGLLVFSAAFNVLASFRHNDLLRVLHPALYDSLARWCDQLPWAIDRWTGVRYGPVELKVIFPRHAVGEVEPLVVTGQAFLSDYVFVHYLNANTIRFGLEHTSRGSFVGDPVTITPGQEQAVRVDMGSLYPPAEYPYFDGMPLAQARLRQRLLRVTLNGKVALERNTEFYDAVAREPAIGTAGGRPGFGRPFTGRILAWRRRPDLAPTATAFAFGPVHLEVVLPPFLGRRSEPLVSTGATGRGDLIYLRYEDPAHVVFGHDDWGAGTKESPPVAVDPAAVQSIDIDFGALYPPAAGPGWAGPANRERTIVRLNGKVVLDVPAHFHACGPDTVEIGANGIQASSAGPAFSGRLVRTSRLAAPLTGTR